MRTATFPRHRNGKSAFLRLEWILSKTFKIVFFLDNKARGAYRVNRFSTRVGVAIKQQLLLLIHARMVQLAA